MIVIGLATGLSGGTEEVYGGGLRPSTVAKAVNKVQDDLDLSHRHVR